MRIFTITFSTKILIFFLALITAFNGNVTGQEEFKYEADNIDYWVEGARRGLVPFNPVIPVKPAVFKSTQIESALLIQDSPDIVVVDDGNETQSENSVFVDPNDPDFVFNSNNSTDWNGSSVNNLYGTNYLFTDDFGQTWTGSVNAAGGNNSGDPAAAISTSGRRHVGYIGGNRGQGAAYSDDGTTWTTVDITGSYSWPDLMDKNHLMVNNIPGNAYEGYVYSAWTHLQYDSPPFPNNREVEIARSTNGGQTWSSPQYISLGVSTGYMCQGVNIQIGPNGEVYATWAIYDNSTGSGPDDETAIGFTKSLNGGSSYQTASRAIDNLQGIRNTGITKNMRVNSFPSMAVDVSGGPNNGNIYIVWANRGEPGINTGTNVSVYMIKSTNGGSSWSTPVRVNQGSFTNGKEAYLPWITCDPSSGILYTIFYDDRNTSSSDVETWVAYSVDAGETWDDFRVSDVSFTPSPIPGLAGGYFGDYLGITALEGKVYPAWTDNRSGRALTYVSPFEFSSYCGASGGCTEHIANVQLNTIDNSTGCDGYADHTDISTDVPLNAAYALTVTNGNTSYPDDQCGVWVDWNDDGDFTDSGETISVSGTPGTGPYTATIDPPTGTSTGEKTMRIRIMWTGSVDPCGSTSYGEVEDYTINVVPAIDNEWTGAIDSDWENGGNWLTGSPPDSDENAVIPGGTPNQPIIYGGTSAFCKDLTIESGAVLTQEGQSTSASYFRVHGDFDSDAGQFIMSSIYAYLYFDGPDNNTWDDDNENDTYTSVRVDKDNSSAQTFMWQNMTVSGGTFEIREGEFRIDGIWTLTLTNASNVAFQVESGGTLILSDENIDVAGGIIFYNGSQANITGGNFYCGGNFDIRSNTSYDIDVSNAMLTMDGGSSQYLSFEDGPVLSLSNLKIDKSGGTCYLENSDLNIAGDLMIDAGTFSANDGPSPTNTYNINIQGDWMNAAGAGGFEPGAGRVIFDGGNYHQYCSDELFNELELDKSAGGAFRVDGYTVECAVFDWTAGAVDVLSGVFTANDLVEDGIYGSWYVNPGGTINLTNNDNWVDLNGNLTFTNGGTMNIYGGLDVSYWTFAGDASITMNGGVLDFKDVGIRITDNSYTFTENISGGTIRTSGPFICIRDNFEPSGGTLEMYTTNDGNLQVVAGSHLHNLTVNKSTKSGQVNTSLQFKPRDGSQQKDSKANTVNLQAPLDMNGDMLIDAGVLDANGNDIFVAGNWTNNAGPSAFVETNATVTFDDGGKVDVNTSEQFYNLTIDKITSGFDGLEIQNGNTVFVNNNLNINDGGVEMNNNSTLIVEGDFYLANNAGLNMFGDNNLELKVRGDWTNDNSSYDAAGHGFNPGTNDVYFDGTGDQQITSNADPEDFYNVRINKSGGLFRPNNALQILGNLQVVQGEWEDNIDNLTHYWHGNVNFSTNGIFNTTFTHTDVILAGASDQNIAYQNASTGYFNGITVDKTTTKTGYTPSDNDEAGGAIKNKDYSPEAMYVTMMTDLNMQGPDAYLIIEEGVLDINGNNLLTQDMVEINDGGRIVVDDNAELRIDDGQTLNVNSGGVLDVIGSAGNEAKVTRRFSGMYAFNVNSGGAIRASNGVFEYAGANIYGVNVMNGAMIDPTHSFHNCTFRYGSSLSGASLITINNDENLTINNAVFPDDGTAEYNIAKDLNQGSISMQNATGVLAGEDFDFDPHNLIDWSSGGIALDLKVWLEGPFDGTEMLTGMNTAGVLPVDQPFDGDAGAVWYYTGTESVGSVPNGDVVDWILVELRDAPDAVSATGATAVATQAGFILNDGSIVDLDGSSMTSFDVTISDNLFVVIYHRNHLAVMSANPLPETGGVYNYDFSTGASAVYGGSNGHKEIAPGIWGMIGGDGQPNGQIGNGDKNVVWNVEAGNLGYLMGDFNLNSQVNNTDKNVIWVPNSGQGSQIPNGATPDGGYKSQVPK